MISLSSPRRSHLAVGLALAFSALALPARAQEQLAPIGITLADGTGFAGDGVGLIDGPGTISFTVPAGATIEQVLLYWNGFSLTNDAGDSTALVNGTTEVMGTLIGGPTEFFAEAFSTTYRADITSLGLVATGANSITVDTDYSRASNGASIVVVIDDGSTSTIVDLRDGQDLAFVNFAPPLDTTVPQTFTFAASTMPRTAPLTMISGSVEGEASGEGDFRPNVIRVTSGGVVTDFLHEFGSTDGAEWDHIVLLVPVPAGATSVTVQVLSADPEATGALPASLAWIVAGLSIVPEAPPVEPASIGDTVFCDENSNGEQDMGEPGIEGVTVNLRCAGPDTDFDTPDDILDSQETDSDGKYLFTDIDPDECRVTVDTDSVPAPCNETGDCPTSVTEVLEAGESFLDADFCFEEPPVDGGEGCTPGYWKADHHFGSWPDDVDPDTLFADIFGTDAFGDATLLDVLEDGGGGLAALGRHAVAAYLNARTIDFGMSADDVIAAVLAAIASGDEDEIEDLKDELEDLNERDCPLARDEGDGEEELQAAPKSSGNGNGNGNGNGRSG